MGFKLTEVRSKIYLYVLIFRDFVLESEEYITKMELTVFIILLVNFFTKVYEVYLIQGKFPFVITDLL